MLPAIGWGCMGTLVALGWIYWRPLDWRSAPSPTIMLVFCLVLWPVPLLGFFFTKAVEAGDAVLDEVIDHAERKFELRTEQIKLLSAARKEARQELDSYLRHQDIQ